MEKTDKQPGGLAAMREDVRPAVEHLLDRLGADLGDTMLSLTVVGSATTEDFHPKFSDINTVLIVQRRSHELLQTLAGYGREMGKRKLRAPLLMTPEYVERSLDVFGIEFLDFQLNHATIIGDDPFAELTLGAAGVRLQCERELKAALMSLRQGYIRSLGKSKLVAGLLIDCVAELAPLMRAMLWLVGEDRPRLAAPTAAAAAEAFGFESETLATVVEMKLRHQRPGGDRVEAMFEDIYRVVDHLSRRVDRIGEAS